MICCRNQAAVPAADAVRKLLQTPPHACVAHTYHPDAHNIEGLCTTLALHLEANLHEVFDAVVQVMHAAQGQDSDQAVHNASCVFLHIVLKAQTAANVSVAHHEQAGQSGVCEAVLAALQRLQYKYSRNHAADALEELFKLSANVHRVQDAGGLEIVKKCDIDGKKRSALLRCLV
jgi:hypothetical protein